MIRLFQNFYFDSNQERQKEIEQCFIRNTNLTEINSFLPIHSSWRLTFQDFFERINLISSEEDINVIANSDIYFDSSIQLAEKIKSNECYALSRWNVQEDGTSQHFVRSDSQDVWIFRGPIKNISANFFLGYRGCDNRLAFEIVKAGYSILNPSLSIKTHHLHLTGIRNYDMTNNFLVPGPYLQVPISSL
jgi:hypothetical protein